MHTDVNSSDRPRQTTLYSLFSGGRNGKRWPLHYASYIIITHQLYTPWGNFPVLKSQCPPRAPWQSFHYAFKRKKASRFL